MWLSVLVVLFSFPLLHEVLKSTRLIRLVRPVPPLRQSMLLRQVELMRLSNMRSAGAKIGWREAKLKLGEDHWITRWMVYLERFKAWVFSRMLNTFRPTRIAKQPRMAVYSASLRHEDGDIASNREQDTAGWGAPAV